MKNDGSAMAAPTRQRLLRLLLERGAATVAELSGALGLSAPAVRRHLDAMLADGTVAETERSDGAPRGRGRPARAFALTEVGHAAFPHAYDDLAVAALRFLAGTAGDDGVRAFAAARVADLERRYRDVARAPRAERPARLAAALSRDGYAATADGGQVCQHHCPVQHVAAEFPQLCEAETELFARVLGTDVRRLSTIAHGEPCCTAAIDGTSEERTAR